MPSTIALTTSISGVLWRLSGIITLALLVSSGSTVCFYVAFQVQCLCSFYAAARTAQQEVREGNAPEAAATRARATALAASASTTVVYLAAVGLSSALPLIWFGELAMVLDATSDALLSVLCAGLVGPVEDREAELRRVGELVQEQMRCELVLLVITSQSS